MCNNVFQNCINKKLSLAYYINKYTIYILKFYVSILVLHKHLYLYVIQNNLKRICYVYLSPISNNKHLNYITGLNSI